MQDLKSLGEKFKEKRKNMDLSLKEVENVISIRKVYLQAIEDGRAMEFLSPVYAIGFMKQYAGFLGYDPEELVEQKLAKLHLQEQKPEFFYGIGTLESRTSSTANFGIWHNLRWIMLTFFILLSAWYFARFLGVIG